MPGYIDYAALKERVTITDALERFSLLDGLTEMDDGSLRGRCPFHDSRSGTTFKVSSSRRGFICFGCDAKGNVLNLVSHWLGCTIHEAAVEILSWTAGDGQVFPEPAFPQEPQPERGEEGRSGPVGVVIATQEAQRATKNGRSIPSRLLAIAGSIPVELAPDGRERRPYR